MTLALTPPKTCTAATTFFIWGIVVVRSAEQADDHLSIIGLGGIDELLRRHVDAEVDDLEAGAGRSIIADEVLADIVEVALDGADDGA